MNNTIIPAKKMELIVIAPVARKAAAIIPLQAPVSEPAKKMRYVMPPQPERVFKGRDNDCL